MSRKRRGQKWEELGFAQVKCDSESPSNISNLLVCSGFFLSGSSKWQGSLTILPPLAGEAPSLPLCHGAHSLGRKWRGVHRHPPPHRVLPLRERLLCFL